MGGGGTVMVEAGMGVWAEGAVCEVWRRNGVRGRVWGGSEMQGLCQEW